MNNELTGSRPGIYHSKVLAGLTRAVAEGKAHQTISKKCSALVSYCQLLVISHLSSGGNSTSHREAIWVGHFVSDCIRCLKLAWRWVVQFVMLSGLVLLLQGLGGVYLNGGRVPTWSQGVRAKHRYKSCCINWYHQETDLLTNSALDTSLLRFRCSTF